jgi:heavy metal translocating P-type ATPase
MLYSLDQRIMKTNCSGNNSHLPLWGNLFYTLTVNNHSCKTSIWPYPVDLQQVIAVFALTGILLSLILNSPYPLYAVLGFGGGPLLLGLIRKIISGDFGSDILAGLSIITAIWLDQYLAGALVVLMLSGGQAIENFSIHKASHVLEALANRAPTIAHRKEGDKIVDLPVDEIKLNDILIIYPHETCPVDGEVIEGQGVMDEAYLTGEPFLMSKTAGTQVISGAINGESALTIRTSHLAQDSRYAKIVEVIHKSEQNRPHLRRLADQLGAWFTPLALIIAIAAWVVTGDPVRFLAVLVIATPCPLLIAIPVVIIASISLCASRGIVIKNPAVLEQITHCKTIIFDKTGTLTYGKPNLTTIISYSDFNEQELVSFAASLERYSKHPLAGAIVDKAKEMSVPIQTADSISEVPGKYIKGIINKNEVMITSRKHLGEESSQLPTDAGLECVILVNNKLAGYFRFRDAPRDDSIAFVHHLEPNHGVQKLMIVSGDREQEVKYLAKTMGIDIIYADQSPEQKLAIVQEETRKAKTAYLGDGINDAPALLAATVGIAFGQGSDITAESADAVIMVDTLEKVDELLHIGQRMRLIALQSALGGMFLSFIGMLFAALGYLPPVGGAIAQEIIDIIAIMNALRIMIPPKQLSDL